MGQEAWVTSAVEDDAVNKSIILAGSLRRVKTSRPLVVMTTLAVSEEKRSELKGKFDRVVVLDRKNPNGLSLEDYAKMHAFSLVDFKKCVYLSPNTLVLKNCDEIFGRYSKFASSHIAPNGDIDHSVYVYTPSLDMGKNLGKVSNLSLWLKNNISVEEMDKQYNTRIHINGTIQPSLTSNASIVNFADRYPLELSENVLKTEAGSVEKSAVESCLKIYKEDISHGLSNGHAKEPKTDIKNTLTSTYKGLYRYTGEHGKLHPNVFDWLEFKRRDDAIGPNLWRVHDKLYNLESFIDRHPGGRDWLDLTRGTDITEAFESSHFVNIANVEKTLAKFYVKDATTPRNSPFTFKEDGFYKTLKRKAEPILQKVGMEPSREAKLIQDALALSYIVLAIIGTLWQSPILLVASGTFLGATMSTTHNFFHKRDSFRRFYWDMGTLSSLEWRISHALSHHNFPNTILDFEVILGEPMIETLPSRKRNWFHKYVMPVFILVLYGIMGLAEFPYRVMYILQGKQKLRPENLIVPFEMLMFIMLSPSMLRGIVCWGITAAFATFWLTFTGNNSSHHHPECFHDGDEARSNPDYGLCQIDATASKTDWYHKNLVSVLTTYGEHVLHHLFPTVCHGKLKHLKPILEETLEEFSEDLLEFTQWQIFVGTHFKQLGREIPHPHRKSKKA